MSNTGIIHILDDDVRRRAAISRTLLDIGYHAELYAGLDELAKRPPTSGTIMVHEGRSPLPKVIEIVSRNGRYLPVAMYSSEVEPERIVAAMLSGALDYLSWPVEPEALRESLERISAYSKTIEARRRREAAARLQVEGLTSREREVLRALVHGASSRGIGKVLGISPRTVEIHRANVMRKIGAASLADVVRIGLYAGVEAGSG